MYAKAQRRRKDYPSKVIEGAYNWFAGSTEKEQSELLNAIMAGFPGAYDRYDVEGLRYALKSYDGLSVDDLRANYQLFLNEVVPTAQELGIKLCVHPDDPPRNILGLPRIVSDSKDIDWIINAFPSLKWLDFCSGSLGASPNNNVVEIAQRYADRIHFAHLRNVRKEPDGSFEETAHLEGDTDMAALCKILLDEEKDDANKYQVIGRSHIVQIMDMNFYQIPKEGHFRVSTYRKAPRTCGNPRRYSCSGLMIKIEGLVLKFKERMI